MVSDDVADPATLDPPKQFVEKNYTLLQQMFEGLARIDNEGRIRPALATEWAWIDDKTLELKLRHGVVFHNGEPFDSKAVRFSIERYLDPKTGFPAAGFLGSIEKVEETGLYTVRIKTKYPDGILMNWLAALVLISPSGYVSEKGEVYAAEHPVGTGPFRFVEWVKGKQIVMNASDRYWAPGLPHFKRLVFRFLSPGSQAAALLRGDVDIVTELPGTFTLQVMKGRVARIIKKRSFYTVGGSINISTGPLSDLRVRQALNLTINREELIRFDLLGNGEPLASLSMPGEIGHNPELKPYPYDPKKARELLREAGYPKGVRLKVIIKYQTERSAKILAKQLERAGMKLEIHKSPDATLSEDIQKGGWDFTFGGCPDPLAHSFFVQSIFLYSRSPFSIMRSPEYDRRLDGMVATLDPKEQDRLGQEVDRYVYEQALSPFTYQKIRTYGVNTRVRFEPSITGMPYFDDAYPEHEQSEKQ
ncbi:MAG: ABC transporter substrate-binding protein [Elusimicrobia bacterium]|nr:ABC transporter substrate-binding protein [Elusimicrobiota bacterium]